MSLYAIADLHLSHAKPKPMDIFGTIWENHTARLETQWKATVSPEDTVLIAGDVSWAMDMTELQPDMAFLSSLPGRKIILSGNHDYWWDSLSKLQAAYPQMYFLKNNFYAYGDIAICGSRGWLCPNDRQFTPHDEKCYLREQLRLRLSLDAALRAGYKDIILMLHYPPTNEKKEPSGFTEIIAAYPQIKQVVYGHLHGQGSAYAGLLGEQNGVLFHLVAADHVAFTPKRILD